MENSENSRNDIEHILSFYHLTVNYIEEFDNILKVYTNNGVFALKSISPLTGMDFIRNVQMIYQRGYNRIVPIYPAQDGRYAVLHNNKLYYLMPWLPNEEGSERNEKHKQMFREIARMHSITLKEIEVKKEEREDHYEQTIDEWKKHKEFLEEFVKVCERKTYMSPYELMFCMYYLDISQALNFSIKKFEEWYEKTKDLTKIRTVTTHGKISTQHFIYDDRGYGYFINFENSRVAPPHSDLLPFIFRSSKTYPVMSNEAIDWLYTYFKYFSFRDGEMELFMAYLAHPGHLIQSVKNYHVRKGNKTEIKYLQQLQRQYWQLKNIEYVVIRMQEIEEQKKQAAAQQQSQS